MITDTLTSKQKTHNQAATMAGALKSRKRDPKWLNSPDELFDWLERHVDSNSNTQTILSRKFGADDTQWAEFDTISLLNHARTIFTEAKERINELETLTTLDPLTGLSNRRGFFQSFLKELDAANRRHTGGGILVMIELDNFSAIRDSHGTNAADHALKVLGNTIFKDIRTMDTAARLEGEEFIVMFPHTNRAKALERAQYMAWALNHQNMTWQGEKIPMNISLGLKEFKAGDSAEDILQSNPTTAKRGANA